MVPPRPCLDQAVPPNWMTKQGGDCHQGLELFQSCHWHLGGLSDQSPPYLVIQFGGTAWSRQGLVCTICFPFLNDCFDCAPRYIQGLWNILSRSTDLCLSTTLSWRSSETSLVLRVASLLWNSPPSQGNRQEQLILFWNNQNHYNLTRVEAN